MLENQAGKGSNIAGSLVASDRGVTSTQKRQRRVENLLNVLVLVGGLSTISGISLLLGFVKNQNFLLFYGLAFVLALAAAGFFFKVIKRLNEKRIDHLLQEKRD
jgi:high-affinity Fe2+/Pb2+ permease